MDFATLTPEVNSGRMYAGPGSGPMLAAAAAWDGLATELHLAASAYGSVISGLTAGPWLGPTSAALAAAVGPYVAWMSTTAALAEQTATQAKAAAAAYEVTFAAMVPPSVIAANRSLLKALMATNLFGQNTPAIAATETHYAEMWAQDAAAMYGYAAVSASAAMLPPFTASPQTTNPGGRNDQSAALTRVTGTSAAIGSQAAVARLTSTVPATLTGLSAPVVPTTTAAVSTSSIFDILQSLGLISPSTFFEPAALGLGSSELSTAAGAWSASAQGDEAILKAGGEIVDDTKEISVMNKAMTDGFAQLGVKGLPAPVVLPGAAAGLGQATPVGALSVPPAWATTAPEMRLATLALPATSLAAAPEAFAGGSAGLFGEMTLASMAGQAINGTVGQGRERIGATTRVRASAGPKPVGGPAPGIADEIREFAELLGKLGDLRDSGLLTDAEFNMQKERLLGTAVASV
jgi:PPE-repeat protein